MFGDQIRGRVFPRRVHGLQWPLYGPPRPDTWLQWHVVVTDVIDGARVAVWADDCRDYNKAQKGAAEMVGAFRRVSAVGQTFRSWRDIVDDVEEM